VSLNVDDHKSDKARSKWEKKQSKSTSNGKSEMCANITNDVRQEKAKNQATHHNQVKPDLFLYHLFVCFSNHSNWRLQNRRVTTVDRTVGLLAPEVVFPVSSIN
jgi:hypothetical protein